MWACVWALAGLPLWELVTILNKIVQLGEQIVIAQVDTHV